MLKPKGRIMPTKKTNKKAAVKKPVVKKAAVKAAAKAPVAAVSQPAPVVESNCCCGCHASCGHKMKRFFVLVIVFVLGWLACSYCCFGPKGMGMRLHHRNNMFVEGCLDTMKMGSPEKTQAVLAADTNADGCITKDEWKEWNIKK